MRVGDVLQGVGALGEFAGAFNNIVCAEGGPVEVAGGAFGDEGDLVAVDAEKGVGEGVDGDGWGEVAHGGVVADEVDEVLDGGAGVVDGDDLEVGSG